MLDSQISRDAAATGSTVGYQQASVCVPVTVTPFAITQPTTTTLCGDAVVTPNSVKCPGKKNDSCTFTISQVICVAVPVEFGATATPGDTYVECIDASAEDICTGCTGESE